MLSMVLKVYALALALTWALATAPAPEAGRPPTGTDAAAPLSMTPTGFPVAPVSLNGGPPVTLVVDTAASVSALLPRLVERLGLVEDAAQRVSVQGASGSRRAALHRVGPVRVGGREVAELSVVVLDAPHLSSAEGGSLHGILGADFLSRFDVELDLAEGELRLEPPGSDAPAAGTEFRALFGRFVVLEAQVDGQVLEAVLDSGARRSLLNRPAARALGIGEGHPSLQVDEPVRGATADSTPAWSWTASRLTAGGAAWREPPIGVSDLPVFRVLGLHERPAMILGANLLRGRCVRIDYDQRRVLIGPPVPTAGRGSTLPELR